MAWWFSPHFPVRCLKWWCRRWKKPWICILDGDVAERCLWWCDSFLGVPKKPGEIRCPEKNINPTTPIAKSHISVDANLVLPGEPFYSKKYRFFNTTKAPPEHRQNSTGTPRKHEQDSKHHENRQDLWTHRRSATKTPTTTETQLKDHQDTSRRTDIINHQDWHHQDRHNQFPKRPAKLLPAYFVTISFSHHHHHNTVRTDIHQHQNTNVIIVIIVITWGPEGVNES